jgi:hypothetical protein
VLATDPRAPATPAPAALSGGEPATSAQAVAGFDVVAAQSYDSFPASDAPSWTSISI